MFVSANELTVEDLPGLSDQDLKDLVPLIGPRNKIKLMIDKLKRNSNNTQMENESSKLFFFFVLS